MAKKRALLVSGLGALALVGAGCGGSAGTGGGSAAGSMSAGGASASGSITTTTTSSGGKGGVLGARVNIDRQALRQTADRIQSMLNAQLSQLGGVSSTHDLAQLLRQTRQRVLNAAEQLDRTNVQNPKLQQQRAHLESLLRSVAADLTSLQGDAQNGNLRQALSDLTNLGSVVALRQSLRQVRNGVTPATQDSLRGEAISIAAGLKSRLPALQTAPNRQAFVNRVDSLKRFLDRHDQRLQRLNVPQAQQDEKQSLVRFVQDWESTLGTARDEARNGSLAQAKQTLARGTLHDVTQLVQRLSS